MTKSDSDLQRLADEISLQARHLTAQRFLLQSLLVLLSKAGALNVPEVPDPIMAMARRVYGADGLNPNPEVLSIIEDMVGQARQSAQVIQFPVR